jgi:hypothetical protein
MKTYTYGGVDVYIHVFLTSALVGGEVVVLLLFCKECLILT